MNAQPGSATATIDGRRVDVVPGETILAAAERAGLSIPALCHVRGLSPEGGCRLCLVEAPRARRPVAACHTELQPGDTIVTASERLQALRHDILALMLSAPGLDAARLVAGDRAFARCLADHGLSHGSLAAAAPAPALPPAAAVDASHPYLRFDAGLCITCRRCVHACEEVQGQFVYGVAGRGASTRLIHGPSERFADSACVACGACVDVCPTAALCDRDRLGAAPAVTVTESVCGYCGTGCRVEVASSGGSVISVRGVQAAAVNRGHLCAKGRYAHGWRESSDRLTTPLLREGSSWRPIPWSQALALAAERLSGIAGRHGPSALGLLTSSRSTNEAAYLLQKLFRSRLRTNNVDCCARVCHASTAAALIATTGAGAATASYADIERARLIVLAGSNPTEAHPVLGARIQRAVRAGARLIVIDPRRIEAAEWADLHLQLRPGTNVALLNALAAALLTSGRVDRAYLDERAEGLAELSEFLRGRSIADAAAVTGVAADRLAAAAELIGASGPVLFVHGLGLSELASGVASVTALSNLALLTGSVGRPGAGLLPLRGQNNVQGNADMGSQPDRLTGYQRLADPGVRERFARAWGRPPPETRGLTLPEMLTAAAAGSLKALWIQGEDVAQSDPHESHVLAALQSLEFLVVQELFLSETARHAHLLLPAASVFEQDGTFTNAERRIQRVHAAVRAPGAARADWEVARDLARALGEDWRYEHPAQVLDEVAAVAPDLFGGVSWDRLGGDGLQWPCPDRAHPGTAIVHRDGFLRGRGRLLIVDHAPSAEDGVPGLPYTLITGRVLQQYNVGTMTRRTPQRDLWSGDVLEMHPDDAAREGIADGARARVESRWGTVEVRARVSQRIAPGTLFLSFHDPDTHANRLVGPCADPVSHCPQYKATAVAVRPAS